MGKDLVESKLAPRREDKRVPYQGTFLMESQYQALEEVAAQFGFSARHLENSKCQNAHRETHDSIRIENGYIVELTVRNGVRTNDASLRIPRAMTHLEKVDCGYCGLQSLPLPPTLTHLRILYCCDNNIDRLVLPPTMTMLEQLVLVHTRLTRLSIPDTLTRMAYLICSENWLQELVIPSTLSKLRAIWCHHNQLRELKIPSTLPELELLNSSYNQLACLQIPSTNESLAELDVRGNKLTHLDLPETLPLTSVDCRDNPLDEETIKALQALKAKGVEVNYG
jgi:hypothetical protein